MRAQHDVDGDLAAGSFCGPRIGADPAQDGAEPA
jgi:hypothetical protein